MNGTAQVGVEPTVGMLSVSPLLDQDPAMGHVLLLEQGCRVKARANSQKCLPYGNVDEQVLFLSERSC